MGAVRLSGPLAIRIGCALLRAAGRGGPQGAPAHARAVFGRFADGRGRPIDQGYLVTFRGPRSFTGEDTAELWAHGSPAVLGRLLAEAVARGARPALPGEFTLRAFLSGRIDATQAEAVRDLVEARTSFQAGVALDQVEGRVSREVERQKERLMEAIARLEASIEFGEEGEAERFLPEGGVMAGVRAIRRELERLADGFERGRRVREGARVAIIGCPNVGKSSLFNRLLEEDRAIVTAAPGTTRDLLEESVDLRGIPVALVDTAGIQRARDEADVEAVRRAWGAVERADLLLAVLDRSRPLREEDLEVLARLDGAEAVVVLNKSDLRSAIGPDRVLSLRERYGALEVSARSGEGVDDLRRRLSEAVAGGRLASREEICLTNVRHHDLVARAAGALRRAEAAARGGAGDEYVALDLKEALDRLGEITGEVGADDIYERIFGSFCIGK